ncbi:hypothetical protein CBR_g36370 [Chara braunii]|nr:hypothetical protein CBR_g36370 [Chara braunii]|eukprot:GBG82841.1 hypothetical protein CBR_g36370 [Chara braunii]
MNDWNETSGSSEMDWNLLWSWSSKPGVKFSELLVWQRVNHYPNAIQLTRKDLLKRHLVHFSRMHERTDVKGKGEFDIMPTTFTLPGEYRQFVEAFEESEEEERNRALQSSVASESVVTTDSHSGSFAGKGNQDALQKTGLTKGPQQGADKPGRAANNDGDIPATNRQVRHIVEGSMPSDVKQNEGERDQSSDAKKCGMQLLHSENEVGLEAATEQEKCYRSGLQSARNREEAGWSLKRLGVFRKQLGWRERGCWSARPDLCSIAGRTSWGHWTHNLRCIRRQSACGAQETDQRITRYADHLRRSLEMLRQSSCSERIAGTSAYCSVPGMKQGIVHSNAMQSDDGCDGVGIRLHSSVCADRVGTCNGFDEIGNDVLVEVDQGKKAEACVDALNRADGQVMGILDKKDGNNCDPRKEDDGGHCKGYARKEVNAATDSYFRMAKGSLDDSGPCRAQQEQESTNADVSERKKWTPEVDGGLAEASASVKEPHNIKLVTADMERSNGHFEGVSSASGMVAGKDAMEANNAPMQQGEETQRDCKCSQAQGEHSENLWIMKPIGQSRGRGIFLINDINEISYGSPMVVQRYISRPLLVDGYKFDLRIYVLVTSFNPLEAFLYKEVPVRTLMDRHKCRCTYF